jgi:hypothetical protein
VYVLRTVLVAHRVMISGATGHQHRRVTDLYTVIRHWYGTAAHHKRVSMYVIARVDTTTPVFIVSRTQDVAAFVRVTNVVLK